MKASKSPVKGRELHTIGKTHRGEDYETYLTVHFSIKEGDLRVMCDVDSRHASVILYVCTGDESVPVSEREYLSIEFSKKGDCHISGYQGNNKEVSDETLALERPLEIHEKTKRWQVCGFVPFFFLPSPGHLEADEFLLLWKINVTSRDLVKNQNLSLVTLKGEKFNPHQIECFEELIMSDKEALRLRSVSRSSLSRSYSQSTLTKDSRNISSFLSDINNSDKVKQAKKDAETTSGSKYSAFAYCETTSDLVKALKSLYPLTPGEMAFAGGEGKAEDAELIKALQSLLRKDEEVLRASKLWCRHGWKHQKVLLVLTADTVDYRLHMLSRKSKKFIRTFPWSITKPVTVLPMSKERFDLEFIESSGDESHAVELKVTYHFLDQHNDEVSVDRLVSSIQAVSKVHDSYLRKSLGSGDHQILIYNLTRTRRESFFDEYCCIM
jgi:hypothetical protein